MAQTSVAQATSASPASSVTSAPDSSTTDVPMELWSIANSLISTYYPSSTITNPGTLTFPSTVVIGSSTYNVHPASSTASRSIQNTQSTATPGATGKDGSQGHKADHSDKTIGIAVGIVVGLIAVAIMSFLIWFLVRRQRRHGGAGKHEILPSDNEIGAWRQPPEMTASGQVSHPSRDYVDRYNGDRYNMQAPPPMAMHPANRPTPSGTDSSEDNPFFTPQERSATNIPEKVYHPHPHELDASDSSASYHRSSSSPPRQSADMRQVSRPVTPFNPLLMTQLGLPQPHRESANDYGDYHQPNDYNNLHQPPHQNPFTSPEDEEYEAEDLVSPIVPSKSPHRRGSPQVHYPSWGEVSEFDFSGSEEGGRRVREQSSSSSGGDGWRKRESVVGRTELA